MAIAITDANGEAMALRMTNRSGQLDAPVAITVPDLSASQTPGTQIIPFAIVNLNARLENFEEIQIRNLQVFANTITEQNLEMIPLSEFPDSFNLSERFDTPPQNL